jgi:hypothetical protein
MGSDILENRNRELPLYQRITHKRNKIRTNYEILKMIEELGPTITEEKILYSSKKLPAGAQRINEFPRILEDITISEYAQEVLRKLRNDVNLKLTRKEIRDHYRILLNTHRIEGTHIECLFIRYSRKYFLKKKRK